MATRLTCPIWIVPFTSLFSRVFWFSIRCLIVTIFKTSKSPVGMIIVIVYYMRCSWQFSCLRLIFYLRLSKISSDETRRCICNVFSHWLRPYSAIDIKKNRICCGDFYLFDNSVLMPPSLRARQNGCDFTDNIFKCIFVNENVSILIKISLKFVPKGPIDNIPALVQIKAWRQPGDLNQWWLVYWCIYAPLGLIELRIVHSNKIQYSRHVFHFHYNSITKKYVLNIEFFWAAVT